MFTDSNIHLIHSGNDYIAYLPETFDIVSLTEDSYRLISLIQQEQISIDEACSILDIDIDSGNSLYDHLSRLISPKYEASSESSTSTETSHIGRITLHVSNDCNLRCSYCYANGGNYSMDKMMMSLETAQEFVEFCINTFDYIGAIVFFGGEPLLNINVIKYICQELHSAYNLGRINYLPKFGAITNGTVFSRHILETIQTYISFMTVSIDGPKAIHDLNRVDVRGLGTFDRIADFIAKIRSSTDIVLHYEATYTIQHKELGYTVEDIRKFLTNQFGINGTVTSEYKMEQERFNRTPAIKNTLPEGFWKTLSTIARKKASSMCPIYRKIFSVSVTGDIYPCHMDTGNSSYYLGNISGDNIYRNKQKFYNIHPELQYLFKDNTVCNSCWMRLICGGCTRVWFYSNSTKHYNRLPNQNVCQVSKLNIEHSLVEISRIRKNKARYLSLLQQLEYQT